MDTSIEWTKDLNTGIDVIDEQHQNIVAYINQLTEAIRLRDRRLVGKVLDKLADYCVSHLSFEESLMEEAGYLYLKPHKAMHDMFVKRLEKYREKYNAGEDISEQLHDMLGTWFVHHIKQVDMAYVSEVGEGLMSIVKNKETGGWLSRSLKKYFG